MSASSTACAPLSTLKLSPLNSYACDPNMNPGDLKTCLWIWSHDSDSTRDILKKAIPIKTKLIVNTGVEKLIVKWLLGYPDAEAKWLSRWCSCSCNLQMGLFINCQSLLLGQKMTNWARMVCVSSNCLFKRYCHSVHFLE